MSKRLKTVLMVLTVIVLAAWAGISWLGRAHEQGLAQIEILGVDLAQVPDGTYSGAHSVFPVSVQVNVTVLEHRITDIQLVKHQNGQGGAAEVIPDQVIRAQSLQVDAITGATASSKVILKAIDNALQSSLR